ncbi:TPA: helix-turn-helix domain-containing protein, partial [Pseudomonas aeruginosa]
MEEETGLDKADMAVSENLRNLRESRGLSQEQVAELCGQSKSSWIKWEHGDAQPGASKIREIAKGLQVSTDEIILEPGERSVRQDLRKLMQKIEALPEHRQAEIRRALKGHLMILEQEEL